ncbi:flavin reductase [Paeniglutamicibacter cryotolerans]|uniref:Flavin reductase (DIM6/NTAB) family NADH-FMN oxidoreductase RutF n=1 Tax=Paeniglutamicibacter cryotolerans TaxID=670079 RepID=A0A839QK62_9MICC|nr:flavin reductase [Paeniglutamicibacter cryotolerans]MBB2996220.1 flavin reductase (DIM6/NTAB) family NADH-FMN oxidoreductase RutF [Paeniglutamicibacter cryotolerans]
MRTIAIVGAGESGAQLALSLQRSGHNVTLFSDRSAQQIRSGSITSSQCVFSSALRVQQPLEIPGAVTTELGITGIRLSIKGTDGREGIDWQGTLDNPALSVDQRVKCAHWIETFIGRGGDFRIEKLSVRRLEEVAALFDLVVVGTGKGELGQIFVTDRAKSPFDRPQRAVAVTYVRPAQSAIEGADPSQIRMSMVPGVGEFFTFPGLSTQGPCQMMVFEGLPGGPMDCWDTIDSPEGHLSTSLGILNEHFPHEYVRFAGSTLNDPGAGLRGRITPVVRSAVGTLPGGRTIMGIGDAIMLNDPLTGQGSNNATLAADHYARAIDARGDEPFDDAWMLHTFDEFWRGWGQFSTVWTNSMLRERKDWQLELLGKAQRHDSLATALANGFDDPRMLFPWWFEPEEAAAFSERAAAEEGAALDLRDFRAALGQFATGVTVVTTRTPQGTKAGMTANSFTSVSMDPPLVLWCPSRFAPSLEDFEASTHFAINVLESSQHVLSRQFATPADDKFAGVAYTDGIAGLPLLDGAIATFECRTVARHQAGDHVIYVGEVEKYSRGAGDPLVFHAGAYHRTALHPDFS